MTCGAVKLTRERMLGGVERPAGLLLGRFESTVPVREVARQLRLERVDLTVDPADPAVGRIYLTRSSVLGGRTGMDGHLLGTLRAENEVDAALVRLAIVAGDASIEEVEVPAPAGEVATPSVVPLAADLRPAEDVSRWIPTAVVPRRRRPAPEASEA